MSFAPREVKKARYVTWFALVIGAGALLVLIACVALYVAIRLSLPTNDPTITLPQVTEPITISRDDDGTASISAASDDAAAFALGFVHAQERFFEMDLTRRSAAGELAALFGEAALNRDKERRIYRFRARLERDYAALPEAQRNRIAIYTQGVNAGLEKLSVRPWQYIVLRTKPEPWREVDSLLVIAEMYSMLQLRSIDGHFGDSLLRERIGDPIFAWLKPRGGTWDGALDGSVMPPIPMPSAAEWSARKAAHATAMRASITNAALEWRAPNDDAMVGSNAWVVSGTLTPPMTKGAAMLSNDMHLGLAVPNIWFRAQLSVSPRAPNNAPSSGDENTRRVVGVSLPGVPAIVVGSNGHLAWGFTNSYGQWFEWVKVDPANPATVPRSVTETIKIKGAADVTWEVLETDLGPVGKTFEGNRYALAWTALQPNAINMALAGIANSTSLEEAISLAHDAGMPHQNMFLADKNGNIGWTIAGKMPERKAVALTAPRAGFASPEEARLPRLDTARVPRIINPPSGRLWSGNNRQLGGEGGALIGDGGFDLGARGQQIRDRLMEKKEFTEEELIAIQYDTEARFLKRWTSHLTWSPESATKPGAQDIRMAIEKWNGKADVDQVGYRVVRAFRYRVLDELWKAWIAELAPQLSKEASWDGRFEYAAWQAVTEKPAHLLPREFKSWDDFLAAQAEWVRNDLITQHGNIADATWGARNKTAIKHPFTRFMPALSPYLDMPATPQSGDSNMPSVAAPAFGASQRLSVAPGHESTGILTMPGGQSGHPLSPFYGAGHRVWVQHASQPLLARSPRYVLVMMPPPRP